MILQEGLIGRPCEDIRDHCAYILKGIFFNSYNVYGIVEDHNGGMSFLYLNKLRFTDKDKKEGLTIEKK